MRILVTRPMPGGEATAARLRSAGHDVVLAPLLTTEPVDWQSPTQLPQAMMLTSATAARLAGVMANPLQDLPCFTVGDATAAAAQAAGWRDVRSGDGAVQQLVDRIAGQGITGLVHLAGEDRTSMAVPAPLRITVVVVYRAVLQPLEVPPPVDWTLFYSPRTARHFAAECDRLGLDRAAIAIAAISPAALAAAGPGWARTATAATANEDALLAAIGVSCQ